MESRPTTRQPENAGPARGFCEHRNVVLGSSKSGTVAVLVLVGLADDLKARRAFLQELLSPVEAYRYEHIYDARARDHFLLGRSIVRTEIGRRVGRPAHEIVIDATPRGKPRLADPDARRFTFSISHAADCVVVAFSVETEIGLDIEEVVDGSIEGLEERALAPSEWADLQGRDGHLRFIRRWTQKEALLKGAGVGLGVSPDKVVFSEWADGTGLYSLRTAPAEVGEGPWYFARVDNVGNLVGSLAAARFQPVVTVRPFVEGLERARSERFRS